MTGNYKSAIAAAFLLLACVSAAFILSKSFRYPLSNTQVTPLKDYCIMDLSASLAGIRRLGADLAWIQLLQYYGSSEKPVDKDTEFTVSVEMAKHLLGMKVEHPKHEHCIGNECHEEGHSHEDSHEAHYESQLEGGVYPELLNYCRRVTEIDPFFYHAYLFGAGALAWNHNRTEEAVELLQSGINNMEVYLKDITKDPKQPYWQLHLYMAAIVYRNLGNESKMISLLEVAVSQPECPNIMKTILASIYQKKGYFAKALVLWTDVQNSGDATYAARSQEKISELKQKLGIKE